MPSDEVLRGLLAAAPDALLAVDLAGNIVFVSDQVEQLFGWTRSELAGQPIEILVPQRFQPNHPNLRGSYFQHPASRPMGAGLELWGRRKDGSEFPAEISLNGFNAGDRPLVAAAIRDATVARRSAHDFNNLLGVILNYTTLLSRQLVDRQSAADLDEIRSAAEHAAALTRQMLAFARREVVNPEALDINEVVTAFSSLLARTLGEHIHLDIDLADEPLVVRADRHQLEQILLNLAVNSRDAMPSGGSLLIVTRLGAGGTDRAVETDGAVSPSHVSVAITDDGQGMDAEVLNRAFEPFFTTKPVGEGTGLGLATVFGIVRQNNGQVTIKSTPGLGTTVSVVLPRVEATPTGSTVVHEASKGGHERILLVEDETRLRVATERILVDHGYEVVTAIDGVDALEVFDRMGHDFELVLTDVVMPRMRGDEMARVLRERRPGIRVLFMSGYDSGHAGLDGHLLEKPVAEHLLLRTMSELLHD